jgi:hypothetical protein
MSVSHKAEDFRSHGYRSGVIRCDTPDWQRIAGHIDNILYQHSELIPQSPGGVGVGVGDVGGVAHGCPLFERQIATTLQSSSSVTNQTSRSLSLSPQLSPRIHFTANDFSLGNHMAMSVSSITRLNKNNRLRNNPIWGLVEMRLVMPLRHSNPSSWHRHG